jgi:hypothetical protein
MALSRSIIDHAMLLTRKILPLPSLWLSADTGVTISDTDRVDSWTSAITAAHVFANTGNNRPTYVANGIGGKPALVFSVAQSRYLSYAGVAVTGSVGTFFAVATFAEITTTQVLYSQSQAAAADRICYVSRRGETHPAYRFYGPSLNTSGYASYSGDSQLSPATSYVLRWAKLGASSSAMTINGAAPSGGTIDEGSVWLGVPTGANISTIGARVLSSTAGLFHDARIAEIIVYSTALSERKCRVVEKYLAAKYGVTWSV